MAHDELPRIGGVRRQFHPVHDKDLDDHVEGVPQLHAAVHLLLVEHDVRERGPQLADDAHVWAGHSPRQTRHELLHGRTHADEVGHHLAAEHKGQTGRERGGQQEQRQGHAPVQRLVPEVAGVNVEAGALLEDGREATHVVLAEFGVPEPIDQAQILLEIKGQLRGGEAIVVMGEEKRKVGE